MKQGYKFSWDEMSQLADNWEQFAKANNGKFKIVLVKSDNSTTDLGFRRFILEIPFSDSKIVFETTESKPLKISYIFAQILNDEFLIYPEDYIDKIRKFFGFKEIVVGEELFDKRFIITGNNEILIRKVLTTNIIKYLLNNFISNFKMEKNDDHTSFIEINIVINEIDMEQMKMALDFFKECIQQIENKASYNL